MHIRDFFHDYFIKHFDDKLSTDDAYDRFLNVSEMYSGISYESEFVVDLSNVDLKKTTDNKYFYVVEFDHDIDMIDSIVFDHTCANDVNLFIRIDDHTYTNVDEIEVIFVTIPFSKTEFVMVFNERLKNDKIVIKYRSFLFDLEARTRLRFEPVETNSTIYINGKCIPRITL